MYLNFCYRYEIRTSEDDGGEVSELLLQGAQLGDSGKYVCQATNDHGSLSADFHLMVQGNLEFSSPNILFLFHF